ncbi:MAG: hypothetical protein ACXVB8_13730 [Bdellovibrionota bacterium]
MVAALAILLLVSSAAKAGDSDFFETSRPLTMHAQGDFESRILYASLPDSKSSLETVNSVRLSRGERLLMANFNAAFNSPGFDLLNPVVVPNPSGAGSFAYFTMISHETREACRKQALEPDACADALKNREIGFAYTNVDGAWAILGPVLKAADSGDLASPSVASAIERNGEVWLYYFTAKHDPAAVGIFLQRFSKDGTTKKGPPERLQFTGASLAAQFERIDVVRLHCDVKNNPFVATMVASINGRGSVPFLVSGDGVRFRQDSNNVFGFEGHPISAPVQLPVRSSSGDCENFGQAHETMRELIYNEHLDSGAWAVKTKVVRVNVNSFAPETAETAVSEEAGKKVCTPADYVAQHPDVLNHAEYAANPMLHYLVFGKDEGACEPSKQP